MLLALVVSNTHRAELVAPVRDPRQRAAVEQITFQPGFDFACMNPFTSEVGAYAGPFWFRYYTKDGRLHSLRIGKTGRILRRIIV